MLKSALKIAPQLEDPADVYCGYVVDGQMLINNILIFKSYKLTLSGNDYHGRYVLAVCLRAAATIVVDDNLFELKPGDAVIIFPYQYHHYTKIENKNILWLFITFEMESPGIPEAIKGQPFHLTKEAWSRLDELLRFYQADRKNEDIGKNELLLRTLLLLNEIMFDQDNTRIKCLESNYPRSELIHKIGQYIKDNLNKTVLVKDLALHFHISESHLRRNFKNVVGMSLGTYIRRTKIQHATKLIDRTTANFSQVAEKCGFDSLYSFSRTFKAEVGSSPSKYRKYLRSARKRKS